MFSLKRTRTRYVQAMHHCAKPGGHVIVAPFGPDGPPRCSGLPVVRYDPDRLYDEFGASFELIEHTSELHQTSFGTVQQLIYCYCRTSHQVPVSAAQGLTLV